MIQNTKRQHYVWQHYLKAWTYKGKLWCKRNNEIFNTATINIAQERYFYEAIPLNKAELELILVLIGKMHPSAYKTLCTTLDVYIATSHGDEVLRKNGLEKYHSLVEDKAVSIINKIREGDIAILEEGNNRINFSYFIGCQYTRTKNMKLKDLILPSDMKIPKEFIDCDFNKIANVLTFLLADTIGNWIYSEAEYSLIRNETQIEFITCDQPVFNLLAIPGIIPSSFELYYPLSPSYALYIAKAKNRNEIREDKEIIQYNEYIKSISYEYVFAKSREMLS